MKKIMQQLFSFKTIQVTDAATGRPEKATYTHILGFPLKTKYQPL